MGRPKELTEGQRADLLARGYLPVEVWVIDRNSDAYRTDAERQVASAAEADSRDAGIDEWTAGMSANLWDEGES